MESTERNAEPLVKADVETRQISLWVHGRQRKDYSALLPLCFRKINNSFEKLTVSERVPMPDDPDIERSDYEYPAEILSGKGINYYISRGVRIRNTVCMIYLDLVQPEEERGASRTCQEGCPQGCRQSDFSAGRLLTGIVEHKVTVLGITFNLKPWWFERLTCP